VERIIIGLINNVLHGEDFIEIQTSFICRSSVFRSDTERYRGKGQSKIEGTGFVQQLADGCKRQSTIP
jgi:hypothetical protein